MAAEKKFFRIAYRTRSDGEARAGRSQEGFCRARKQTELEAEKKMLLEKITKPSGRV